MVYSLKSCRHILIFSDVVHFNHTTLVDDLGPILSRRLFFLVDQERSLSN
jgi:hypothetical protein